MNQGRHRKDFWRTVLRLFGRLGQARRLGGREDLGIPLDNAWLSSEFYLV